MVINENVHIWLQLWCVQCLKWLHSICMRALIAVHKKIALQRLAILAHDMLFPPRLPAGLAWWWFLWTLSGDSEYRCFGLWRPMPTPVSVPAPSQVGHLHTGVQQFTRTDTCLCTRSVTGGSPPHRGTMVEVHTQQWGDCRCYCLMLIPVSVPALSGVGHLLTGVQNYKDSHTSTPLYLLIRGGSPVHMVTAIYTQQWW